MTHPISGVLKAYGVFHAKSQGLVRKHCEAGNSAAMVLAVSDALLAHCSTQGHIPPNIGVRTRDLDAAALAALHTAAEIYHSSGGVLVAKGYVSVEVLAATMHRLWVEGWASPIKATKSLAEGLSDPEVNDRLTVVAQSLRHMLNECPGGCPIDPERLEGFCKLAALQMFRAFQDPNAENHRLIHGAPP